MTIEDRVNKFLNRYEQDDGLNIAADILCELIGDAVEEMRERAAKEAEGQVWDDSLGFIQDQIAAAIRALEVK